MCPSHLMGAVPVVRGNVHAAAFPCFPAPVHPMQCQCSHSARVLGSHNHTKVWCYMMLCGSIAAKACRVLRKQNGMGWGTRKLCTFCLQEVRQSGICHQKNWAPLMLQMEDINGNQVVSVLSFSKSNFAWLTVLVFKVVVMIVPHYYGSNIHNGIFEMPCVCRPNWEKQTALCSCF